MKRRVCSEKFTAGHVYAEMCLNPKVCLVITLWHDILIISPHTIAESLKEWIWTNRTAEMCETDWFQMHFWLWFRKYSKFSVSIAILIRNSLLRHFWFRFRIGIYYFDTFGFNFEIKFLFFWVFCKPLTIIRHWELKITAIMTSLLLNKTLYWFLFQFWTRQLFAFRFWFWFWTFCR